MIRYRIDLSKPLNATVMKQLVYRIRYHHPEVSAVRHADDAFAIDIESAHESSRAAVENLVRRSVQDLGFINRASMESRVLLESAPGHDPRAPEDERARYLGALYRESEGSNLSEGEPARLVEALDDWIVREVAGPMAARPLRVPSTIAVSTLQKLGYIETSNQYLSFCSHLSLDFDRFSAFQERAKQLLDGPSLVEHLAPPERALNPAVCLHVYPWLSGQALPAAAPTRVTVRSACFRFESGNHNQTSRLFEFSMREVVMAGARAVLQEELARCHRLLGELATRLGLRFRLVTASDIFFGANSSAYVFAQMSSMAKLELEMWVPGEERWIAVASVNDHGERFSLPAGLALSDGGKAETMCLGFGLERFALALHQQLGERAFAALAGLRGADLWKP